MTPERTRLREAITRHRDIHQFLSRATAARDKAHATLRDRYGAVDDAEQAKREAEASAPSQRLADLMGDAPTGLSVDQAQQALDAANANLAAARNDERLVDWEIARLEERVRWAALTRQEAMRAVCVAEPNIANALAELHSCRERILTLEAALAEAGKHDLIENRFWANQRFYQADPALAAQWRTAIAALAEDAATPLPGDPNPPPSPARQEAA